ncbi:heme utilization cystosolic carrier protein HutX [Vibrio sonorensis]|uniref:heme utilization cystosolic carrier protein HutX n=1 Tax=Vibrio sonorensis TaxID=1004316 RepID=UPI0008DB14C5|nr:heme utilization cystosolic carrier protein HutX [Vibrio sonorensis]
MNTDNLKNQVAELLESEPKLLPVEMAEKLSVSEYLLVAHLPSHMVTTIDGSHAQHILETLADFGPVTTIVHSFGSIFEVKASFPRGKIARGYYNLMGEHGELHGHLKLDNIDNIANIAFVSKPFMGRESHYFGFFCPLGNNIFKVYLGRDEQRRLIPQQVERFKNMQNNFK